MRIRQVRLCFSVDSFKSAFRNVRAPYTGGTDRTVQISSGMTLDELRRIKLHCKFPPHSLTIVNLPSWPFIDFLIGCKEANALGASIANRPMGANDELIEFMDLNMLLPRILGGHPDKRQAAAGADSKAIKFYDMAIHPQMPTLMVFGTNFGNSKCPKWWWLAVDSSLRAKPDIANTLLIVFIYK